MLITLNSRTFAGLSMVVLCVNLLFCKSVGCGGPKLTGVRLGRVSSGELWVQGCLWKKNLRKVFPP